MSHYVLYEERDGRKFLHRYTDAESGVVFVPVFPYKKDALKYRNFQGLDGYKAMPAERLDLA
jgi:hypothetical protein